MTPALFPRSMSLKITDFEGEGFDLGSLSTKFQISRSGLDGIGFAKISVFNLHEDTIAKLQARGTLIQLDAGYPDRIGTIFKGQVRNVFPVKDGADRIVDIFCADGATAYQDSVVSANFTEGTTLKSIIQTVAATFIDIAVGSLEFLTDRQLVGSYTAAGMTRDVMKELADSYGFRWSIQGGILQVVSRDRNDGQPSLEVSRETGMIDSPLASTGGIEVLTLLDHRIIPGRRISVITAGAQVTTGDRTLQQGTDGEQFRVVGREFIDFEVLRLVHVGESRGQPWYTKAFARPIGV